MYDIENEEAVAAAPSASKPDVDPSSSAAPARDARPASHPTYELAAGETCHSLAWWRNTPSTIVAGMNSKSLKIFDIRVDTAGSGRPSGGSNFTRAVYGVCVDPFLDVSSKLTHPHTRLGHLLLGLVLAQAYL